jgi:hypothetical protein
MNLNAETRPLLLVDNELNRLIELRNAEFGAGGDIHAVDCRCLALFPRIKGPLFLWDLEFEVFMLAFPLIRIRGLT